VNSFYLVDNSRRIDGSQLRLRPTGDPLPTLGQREGSARLNVGSHHDPLRRSSSPLLPKLLSDRTRPIQACLPIRLVNCFHGAPPQRAVQATPRLLLLVPKKRMRTPRVRSGRQATPRGCFYSCFTFGASPSHTQPESARPSSSEPHTAGVSASEFHLCSSFKPHTASAE
jgi:hypothetical protein